MEKMIFDQNWRFHLGNVEGGRWGGLDTSAWRLVDLPHDWSIELKHDPASPSGTSGGFFPMGMGWYVKTFDAPQSWQGKKVFIEFEGVYMNAEVWLNGSYLGRHPYGYTSFTYDLTPYLQVGAQNILKVFVDNSGQLNSRWYSGSGIYRRTWLLIANPLHIGQWGVYVTTPEASAQQAVLRIQTRIENDTDAEDVLVRSRLLTAEGAQVGIVETQVMVNDMGKSECVQSLRVLNPHLWSPDDPALYRLESEVLVGGEVVDSTVTTLGIRSLEFSAAKGFLLNGQELKLKGGCVHHDNGILGSAAYDRSEERKVEVLKASGYNAVRCAHNPPSPAFLDACDRLGMLVIDEAFDCWREGKNHHDYHVAFDDWWQRDLESMIYRDRNHPSIIMWSIGNEVLERDGRSGGGAIARMLADHVRLLDPTRPVTSAICGVWDKTRTWEDTDEVFATLDVGGYNYQQKQYQPDHERCPQRIIYGSESTAREAFEHWMSVLDLPYVIGDFIWTSLDYLGEAGIGRVHFEVEGASFLGAYPWHQANCGDIDLCGFKRPQSYYRDVLWRTGDKLYIAVHTPVPEGKTPTITYWGWPDVWPNWNWPGKDGQVFKVDVYSACEQVRLFLNGKSLGRRITGREERFMASFNVPYQPGALKAVGYINGQKAAECILRTTGEPYRIRLTPDRSALLSKAGDLSFITVEVVDKKGLVIPDAEAMVYFTIKGAGVIAAVGSSNPISVESYRGNQRQAFRGRCLVVVKTLGQPGDITLRAQADNLEGAEVIIWAV